ncbi:CLUMA_CG007758, isoform A [Clunio marinus]|uniref:CLUMA_CG007758, isoform A n=1 Tax=Clunio marinus TaxID=568069 RepID=A0A1J1I207_9DIPT|nr:CLUMA_CG007758, isoform A [Clunio marinus]
MLSNLVERAVEVKGPIWRRHIKLCYLCSQDFLCSATQIKQSKLTNQTLFIPNDSFVRKKSEVLKENTKILCMLMNFEIATKPNLL